MKKKVTEDVVEETCKDCTGCQPILPITEQFGNGDLNTLRDKINEIIGKL